MDLRLTVAVPGQRPLDFELISGNTYTLGRSDTCDIVVASAYVSRTPVRVEWSGAGFDIVDTANRNPFVINGYPLSGRATIKAGDNIAVGDVTIAVQAIVDPNATMMIDPSMTQAPGMALPADATSVPPPVAAAPASAPVPIPVAAAAPRPPAAPPRPAGTDYGTLRVRNADGGVNEYSIDARTVVVGRASGVGISIEDDIAVDRRHFQIRIDDGVASIEDLGSAGGTFLGSQRLQPNTIHRLGERQVIRFGNCEAELLPPALRTGAKERAPTITLSLAPPTQPITPGGTTTAMVTIQNRGKVVDQISLQVPDVDPAWVELRRQTVSLVPGARDEVAIVFKPPKTSAARAGEHPFAVSAVSAESGNEVRALGNFTILPFEALEFSVRPKGKKGQFTLHARNGGNAPTAHMLSATDEDETLKYEFDNEHLELGAGEEKSLLLRVKPKRKNPFGQNKSYRFALEAKPEKGSTTRANAAGAFTYRAPFRRWKSLLVPVLAAVGLGTVMIFARGNPATIINWFRSNNSGNDRPPVTRTIEVTQEPTTGPTTDSTTAPPTAEACAVLAEGCTAEVINSPDETGAAQRSCLRVREDASRTAAEIADKLCNGAQVELLEGPVDADGFRWWRAKLENGTEGFIAERALSGSGSALDVGPWIKIVE